ncbi:MAG: hypothetical protein II859_13980 [Bacteroidales bacterium]|nr:hypothetical protein [Bacteroidales bacterium]
MKKTITLIMMFVLSVGFLMAQGVFTYQSVVVDNQGKLVVNKQVTATVTITDGTHTFEQSNLTGTTSANGLLVLSVGDKTSPAFNNMNWEVATINVKYTVGDVTVPEDNSQIPAVPYAFQSDNALTTQMIIDYIKGARMDDVREILNAMEHGTPTLKDTLIATVVDTAKANYKLAKQVFMSYVEQATAADLDILYNALVGNQEVMDAIDTILVQFVKDSTEMVYDILRQYALHLTASDVNAIIAAIPPTSDNQANVKSYIVNKVFEYLMTENAKKKLFIPVIMDYAKNAQTGDVDALVSSIQNNPNGLYDTLLNKFNYWMDEYFAHHYTGGNNNSFVQTTVNNALDQRYYTCDTEVDLCQLKHDLDSISSAACFTFPSQTMTIDFQNHNFVGTAQYVGPEADIQNAVVSITVTNGNDIYEATIQLSLDAVLRTEAKEVNFQIPEDDLVDGLDPSLPDGIIPDGASISFKLSVSRSCSADNAEISGIYHVE